MNKTLYYIAEEVSELLKCSIEKAVAIVEQSFLPILLEKIPDYIQHYTADYWAVQIVADYTEGDN
nr:MAG TPA: hypothetical protein [Caudoviricetes sp.]